MNNQILELKGISKSFSDASGSCKVLADIAFSIAENEIVCLMGPSGCGKSTILRIINGLESADSGIVKSKGSENSVNIKSTMVFQDHNLFPWLSVFDNIAYGMRLKKRYVSEEKVKEMVSSLLSLVHLEVFSGSKPYAISGGMRQRVAVARALAIEPDILLMDEPFNALDTFTRRELQNEVIRIREEMKTTFLIVTHNPDEAVYLADKIVILSTSPATINEIISVPLKYPRDTSDPDYVMFVQKITSLIKATGTNGRS